MAKILNSRPTLDHRTSGVLLHITSLPGPYFNGDMGQDAYRFVDFLAQSKQSWWQMLPLNPIGDGNSPYSTVSSFAGEPLFIDLLGLVKLGLLQKKDIKNPKGGKDGDVKFNAARKFRFKLLQLAFQNSLKEKGFYTSPDYLEFKKRNRYWIDDYCLFEALSEEQKTKQWSSWPIGLRNRQESAMKQASIRLASAIMYQEFMQYIFDFQWRKLRSYAASKHIALLGDIPIFVSLNSADVWAKQNLFLLDKDKKPTHITGVPPDRFNADGQLWGNAFYRWNTMKADGYSWWIERLKRQLSLFDGIRLDHFIGFYRCWRVAAGAKNARVGEFVPGPRDDFFEVIQEKLGHLPLVAEDLGLVIPEVEKLRDKFELPGMKVLQFAFGGEDQDPSHKPYRIPVKSVVYPGTHDNNTTKGWYKSLAKSKVKDKQCALEFRNVNRYIETSASTVAWDFIRLAMASPASVSILPAQDLLSLPSSARMNIPGTAEGNWKWRLKEKALDSKVAAKLSDFTEVYGRVFKV